MQKNGNFCLSVKKSLLLKSSISRDVDDLSYVCFFGVFSNYLGCTICLQFYWRVVSVETVNLLENGNFFSSIRKTSLKVFYFSRCR